MEHISNFSGQTNALDWLVSSDKEREALNRKSVNRNFGLGDTVFHEGDACQGMYFVLSGLIGIRKTDAEGCSVLLHLVGPGDPIGYNAFVSDEEYAVSAECLEASTLAYVPKAGLLSIFAHNPEVTMRFLQRAVRYLGDADLHAFEALTMSARARVIRLLASLAERYASPAADGSAVIALPFSRRDMADIVGIRPESISRVIRQLIDEGIAEFDNRHVRVPAMNALYDDFDTNLAA